MEAHYNAGVVLLGVDNLLIVCFTQEGQGYSVGTQGRLDYIGKVFFIRRLVEVFKTLARGVLVLSEVKVGPVRNTPELAPAEREQVFDVGSGVRVVGEFLLLVVSELEVLRFDVSSEK